MLVTAVVLLRQLPWRVRVGSADRILQETRSGKGWLLNAMR